MWPQALQMTREECRGILRRLELDSYSQVISVFRAQGGLSDAKAKLLEELRGIFHISNERHRAEARRVANDEQLATIAEAISGPNTWQEWSREGRRPYPMLPRVAPQTALALLANNVAEETAQENAKLPYPAETADAVKEEQQQIENQKLLDAAVERNNYVVTNDPFKMPEIPSNPKKNLKRNSDHQNAGTGKKRSMGDGSTQQSHSQMSARKNYPHITANSPQANITASLNSNANSERKQKLNPTEQYIEKQRFFHRQQQLNKQKMAKKSAAAAAAAAANNASTGGGNSIKRHATQAKSGRRANQKLQQEQQKQLAMKQLHMEHMQQQLPMQVDLTIAGGSGGATNAGGGGTMLTQQQIDMQFVTYATHHQPPQQIFMDKDIEMSGHAQVTGLPAGATAASVMAMPVSSSNQQQTLTTLITPLSSPQIAASKRDISKNFNKLQMQQSQQLSSLNVSNMNTSYSGTPTKPPIPSHDLQTSLGNILSSSAASSSTTSSDKNKTSEKTLISTTPVQKYIVEERQPGVAINTGTLLNIQNPHGSMASPPTHIIQVSNTGHQQPQIMSFPQISAAATKLRAVNTTLIAPGSKISSTPTKKLAAGGNSTALGGGSSTINAGALHELANVASTQSQVLHIVEAGTNNNQANTSHATPLHTPPAVIQIHNTSGSNTVTSSDILAGANQSKVLTTKILPLVLSGSTNQSNTSSSLLNNSSLVMASSASSSISITSTTATAGGSTIIKNLSSNMVLNTSTANLMPVTVTSTNNPIISTLNAGANVFRKPPNIIKTPISGTTPTKSSSLSSAPHIISNVKLTPVSVSPTSAGTHLTTSSTFKNVLPSTSGMVRTSVKICQSPNGKVFIQPAGLVDGNKMKLSTGAMPHKIISSTSTPSSSATTSSGQRIAIQKVQIIPAPMGSPAASNTLQTSGNHINTKAGKSNMIFMPTSSSNVRPVTLSKMGNNLLLKSSSNQQLTPTSPTTTMASVAAAAENNIQKSNIVVLGPSPTTPVKEQIPQSIKLENTQSLINEDTPLDILNMPIVMEAGVGMSSSSSTAAETVTVLPSNIIDASNVSSSSAIAAPIILDQTQLNQSSKTVVLNVDWEMKLDIEQQNQYNNKNLKQNKRASTAAPLTTSTSGNQRTLSPCPSKSKRLNNDYISIAKEASNLTVVTTTTAAGAETGTTISNSANNIIVLDDSFDDVIVEEHEDDASSVTSLDKHHQQQQQQTDNDIPKILDMQIYQQHDGHNNRIVQMSTTTNNNDDMDVDVDINVDDDDDADANNYNKVKGDNDKTVSSARQSSEAPESIRINIDQSQPVHYRDEQQEQHGESEIDAGFDETIVTEIDENTAIEYIEEDRASSNVSTTTTAANTCTTLSKKNNIQQKMPTNTLSSIAATRTTIPQRKDANSSNSISKNHLLSSTAGDKLSLTATESSNETLAIESAASIDSAATTTTANNSATQQVEP